MQWQALLTGETIHHLAAGFGRHHLKHSYKIARLANQSSARRSLLSRRTYASESDQYKHAYAGPPPPPVPLPKGQERQQQERLRKPTSQSSGSADNKRSPSTPDAGASIANSSDAPAGRSALQNEIYKRPIDGKLYAPDLPPSFGINQHAAGISLFQTEDPQLQRDLEAIVQEFRAPIRYAFAYGSGVFKQKGYGEKEKPMLDFVFAVSHPNHWHSINISQHKEHYSFIARMFGSNVISILQNKVGAGVWFNVECLVHGRVVKYGVISVDTLVKDLMDWETLYMAGRMHKPINVLRDEPRIKLANQVNLSSAVRASLLLLPETFSEEELYREITSLSYRGDFRMAVGENPNKIKNIVSTQSDYFQKLYQPILRSYHRHLSFLGPEGSGSIRQDVNPRARAEHARRLPLKLREMLQSSYDRDTNILKAMDKKTAGSDIEPKQSLSEETAQWVKIVSRGTFKHDLDKCIQMIVAKPAFSQSMKGVFSVGPVRGVRYVWPKLKKKWFSSS